jgi:hypothetical protein
MAERHAERLIQGRVFTEDQWADYLIYRNYPKQRTFVDGRSDFFGKELGEQYLTAALGRTGWAGVLSRNRIDVVLSPVNWSLCSLLRGAADWAVVEEDGQAALFQKVEAGGTSVPVRKSQEWRAHEKNRGPDLMKPSDPAE